MRYLLQSLRIELRCCSLGNVEEESVCVLRDIDKLFSIGSMNVIKK